MKQKDLERAFEGWHLNRDFYGEATVAEVTLTFEKENFYLGVGIHINFEGSYQLRLTDKSFAETGKYTLYLAKRSFGLTNVCSASFEPKEFAVEKGVPFVLKLERDGKVFRGFVNGVLLLTYEERDERLIHEEGWCGVWIHPEKAAVIHDFSCEGDRKPLPTESEKAELKGEESYKAKLRDIFVGKDVSGKSEKHLHIFEENPTIKMKVSFRGMSDNSSCGLLIRHAPHTAYVRIGYQASKKRWFIEDVPALYDCKIQRYESEMLSLSEDQIYEIKVVANEDTIALWQGGTEILLAKGVCQTGFGRIGFFAEDTDLHIHEFLLEAPNACPLMNDVLKHYVDEDHYAASTEIHESPNGTLVGITKVLFPEEGKPYHTGIYTSLDQGEHFERVGEGQPYSGLDTKGTYQSVLQLNNGKYIQVLLAQNTLVQESEDMIHWKTISKVIPDDWSVAGNPIFHVNSLAEYKDASGNSRIFIPIALSMKTIDPETKNVRKTHDTYVFYSDDDGYTWARSENSFYDVLQREGYPEITSVAECKVVKCADGTLRLYNSRNDCRFICYIESRDFGKTWSGFQTVRELQCAKSSFGVVQDPYEEGTYYMAWVNDKATYRGSLNGRTRLSLARSCDGKTWKFLCDAEHTSLRYVDDMAHLYRPLYQILDPSVTVTKDYVFVTYGISPFQSKDAEPGSLHMIHHEQRPAFVRFSKAELKELPWNRKTISDMSLLDKHDSEVFI